ncbi:hypothetical protein Gohar_019587 [Gossypium harknessii]|uniref:Cytochrome P450 n=1 Tax=Gossypium harknessii TaxID=34285 RepID=A0A7J9IAZ0_9ROSI|nr:hypothetical protein [Gossypium harknessii]
MDEETVEKMDPITKNVLITLDTRINDFLPILRPVIGEQRKRALQRRVALRNPGSNKSAIPFSYLYTLFYLKVKEETQHHPTQSWSHFAPSSSMPELIPPRLTVGDRTVEEKVVEEMKYLQAIVNATTVGGFNIPIDPNLEIFFPGITEDPKIWSNPEKFNPADRFYLGKEDADITGVTMVKMKPFGAGTRICPGLTMATVHIHLMLARMVQQIERTSYPPNSNFDFSGKFEFTVVMSNTLKARIKPMGGIR